MRKNYSEKTPTVASNPTAGQYANETKNFAGLPTMTSDWHRMGEGYLCKFSIKHGGIQATWSPAIPPAPKLRRIVESGKYRTAQHSFLLELSARVGGSVLCVDL